MTIKTTITALGTLLTGLQNDDASLTIQRIFTATPEQPQLADFPALVIEFPPDQAGVWKEEALGLGRNDYALQIMILVGDSAVTPVSQLHDLAIAWVKPIADKFVSDIRQSGAVVHTGYFDTNAVFTYFVQPITWNQQQFYGVRVLLGVTEKPVQTMA